MALNKVKDVALDSEKIGILSGSIYVDSYPIISPETNDTARIQRAIQAAFDQKKACVFSPKTYNVGKLSIPWSNSDPFRLVAEGTVLNYDGTGDCCLEVNGSFRTVQGIKFVGDSLNPLVRIAKNSYRNHIIDNEFKGNNNGIGVQLYADSTGGAYWNNIAFNHFYNLDKDIFANNTGTYGANANIFSNNTHLYTVTSCIETKASYNTVIGGNFEQMNYANLAAFRIIGDGALNVYGATVESASNLSYVLYMDNTVVDPSQSSFYLSKGQGKYRSMTGTESTSPGDMPFSVQMGNDIWGKQTFKGDVVISGGSSESSALVFKGNNPAVAWFDQYRFKMLYQAGEMFLTLQTWADSTAAETWDNLVRWNSSYKTWDVWDTGTSTWLKPAKGISTQSGNGSATSKTIAHSIGKTPSYYQVQAGSIDAGTAGIKYIEADATNITVYFNTAPITGTNNLKLIWEAQP